MELKFYSKFRSQQEFEDVFRCRERLANRFVFLRSFNDEQIQRYLETHTDDADFYWQQIQEIFDLHDLAKRLVLHLSFSGISDLSPLRELRQLKTLWLQNNPLPKDQVKTLKKALPGLVIGHRGKRKKRHW